MPRAERGFTLLEVLAAVALLAILYTVLARAAIEGLRAEGDSERRLEASLLVDDRLYDLIEMSAAVGQPLELGRRETTIDDFTLVTEVTPFAVPPEWGLTEPDGVAPLLFAQEADGSSASLRTVQMTLSWLEAGDEHHVTRTGFAVDLSRVADLAAAAAQGAAPAGAATEPEELPAIPEVPEAPSELEEP
jgi:prepilin-type N-terminal cleavage/methylation domain-containing protein